MIPRLLLLLAFVAPVVFAGTPPATVSPKIQQRIDALLQRRLLPQALPASPPNPFQTNGAAVRTIAETDSSAEESEEIDLGANPTHAPLAPPNMEILTSIASRLKVGGIIVLKDRFQVVINGLPRREGDLIAADWSGTLLYVKIAKLAAGEITLRYADAEVLLRF